MLVKFVSSETGELMMFADMAGTLLRAVGKETGRRGAFTREEMLPAAQLLRAAMARGEAGDGKANDDDEGARAAGCARSPRLAADRHAGADRQGRRAGQYRLGSGGRFLVPAALLR